MSRGKRKADMDQGPKPKRRQAAPHKRGGRHRVKPEHLTGTHWDDRDHKELLGVIKRPNRVHLFRKDMKKHEMARALADEDAAIARGQREKERQIKKQKIEATKKKEKENLEKLAKEKEKQERKADRERRRLAGDEDVSETTDSEQERELRGNERYGTLIEDSMSSSSESETTMASSISPIHAFQKLRIFECQDLELPSLHPRKEHEEEDPLPLKIPYTVMKLVTTASRETLELPGRNYPDDIDTDHVPRLSPETIMAARNGTMVGALRKATIESGTQWAKRTHVQGWNARMYLQLPARTSAVPLADVYAYWHRNRKGKTGIYEYKTSRAAQDPDKYREKRNMLLDIYASSKYRPPICYIPAYLDYPWDVDEDYPVSIENLFYVRFPGMDLPHYYFWTEPGDWADPTIPNPEWKGVQEIDQRRESRETKERRLLFENAARNTLLIKTTDNETLLRPFPLDNTRRRVKKKSIPRKFQTGVTQPRTSKYKSRLWTIERQLYRDGLSAVLLQFRNECLEAGRDEDWEYIINKMSKVFPSGKLPDDPPVHVNQVPRSVAEKLAAIEVPNPERLVSPIRGDEPWTRNDDEYWDIVDIPDKYVREEDIQQQLLRNVESLDLKSPSLMRRQSTEAALPRNFREFDAWLKNITPESPPLNSAVDEDPVGKALRIFERQMWEDGFEKHALEAIDGQNNSQELSRSRRPSEVVPELITQIESMPVEDLKWQLYTLMDEELKHDICRVCLEPLGCDDPAAVYEHYQGHRDEADSKCPFCSMDWGMLGSHWKANHILFHEWDDYPLHTERLYRRRSSSTMPPALKASVPSRKTSGRASNKSRTRSNSKVTFAPVTVERRIAYNDLAGEDPGLDADVSSLGAPSPRKSSLKLQHRKAEKQGTPRKPSLKVETKIPSKIKGKAIQRGTTANSNDYDISSATVSVPSTASSYQPTKVRAHKNKNDDGVWEPAEGSSSEDHVPSPYLHHFVGHDRDNPNASYKPRKQSQTSIDSYEFHVDRRGKKKDKKTAPSVALKLKGGKGKRKASDAECEDVPSSPLTGPLPFLESEGRKRRKLAGPSYRALQSPSTNAPSHQPPLEALKKCNAAPTKRRASTSSLTKAQVARLPTVVKSTKRKSSTISNASSGSHERRASELTDLEAPIKIAKATDRNLKSTQPASKRDKISKAHRGHASADALLRRASGGTTPWAAEDYIPFGNEPDPELDPEDMLTGNPFAPLPKKTKSRVMPARRTITRGRATTSRSRVTKAKSPTIREKAFAAKHLREETSPAKRRSGRNTRKPTLSGRLHIEPIPIASAKRMSLSAYGRRPSTASRSTIPSVTMDDVISMPPTPSPTHSISPSIVQARQDRATKSKQSSSQSKSRSSSASSGPLTTYRTPSLTALINAPIGRIKRTTSVLSYDVPFSDARPLVPPNTPARKTNPDSSALVNSGGELNVRELNERIGKMKTTRGGLVRELSVLGKGRPRGRSVPVVRKKHSVWKQAESKKGKGKVATKKAVAGQGKEVEEPTKRVTRAASRTMAAANTVQNEKVVSAKIVKTKGGNVGKAKTVSKKTAGGRGKAKKS